MERREGIRIPLDLDVLIHGQTKLLGPGRLVNASRSGVLVRTPLSVRLYKLVKLQFLSSIGEVSGSDPLEAFVVRQRSGVVGLAWDDPDLLDVAMLLTLAPKRPARVHTSATLNQKRSVGRRLRSREAPELVVSG